MCEEKNSWIIKLGYIKCVFISRHLITMFTTKKYLLGKIPPIFNTAKGKVFPVHVMKAYRGKRGTCPPHS
jgi:hypothetical protein